MRRATRFMAAVAGVLTLLAGCADTPAGVDRNLTDDWPAFAAPAGEVPVAGTCYASAQSYEWRAPYAEQAVGCDQQHRIETVSVGTFPADLAGRADHPARDSTALAPLFHTCADQAREFLGAPWQSGYVTLNISVPSTAAWRAGARWYACNLTQVTPNWAKDWLSSTGSLRGALTRPGLPRRSCELVTETADHKHLDRIDWIDCAQPHNGEFAGLLVLTDASYPTDDHTRWVHENWACSDTFQAFIGVPFGESGHFGFYHDDITREQWNLGVRTMACIILADDDNGWLTTRYTGSARGLGKRKPANWTGS
jgi:hypothetical protein